VEQTNRSADGFGKVGNIETAFQIIPALPFFKVPLAGLSLVPKHFRYSFITPKDQAGNVERTVTKGVLRKKFHKILYMA
jgi:hypothetical protein